MIRRVKRRQSRTSLFPIQESSYIEENPAKEYWRICEKIYKDNPGDSYSQLLTKMRIEIRDYLHRAIGNPKIKKRILEALKLLKMHTLDEFEKLDVTKIPEHLIPMISTNINGILGRGFETIIEFWLKEILKISKECIELRIHLRGLDNVEVDVFIKPRGNKPAFLLLIKVTLRERGKQWKEVSNYIENAERNGRREERFGDIEPIIYGIMDIENKSCEDPSKRRKFLSRRKTKYKGIHLISIRDEEAIETLGDELC
jgi:siroheme synthase (precorrin-2 oxidase/ferrochelatase)